MSAWTHAMCERCWREQECGQPVRLAPADIERCGWCGRWTKSGIYRRADPATVPFAESEGAL